MDDQFSFNQALAKLQSIVNDLEDDGLDLKDAIAKFEEAITLSQKCKEQLDKAEAKIIELNSTVSDSVRIKDQDNE